MALPAVLQNLTLPVIASPMFIVSYPELVLAQCKAGIVGSFPALNARPAELLDEWLTQIQSALADHKAQHPDAVIGPSNILRTSPTSANGDVVPAWPPAPAATRISPSTPASSAFCAWRRLITSCSTMPP